MMNCQADGLPEPQTRWKVENIVLAGQSDDASSQSYGNAQRKSGGRVSSASQINSNTFHSVISNPHMQILENGSLLIKEVNRNDHRRYMCSGE